MVPVPPRVWRPRRFRPAPCGPDGGDHEALSGCGIDPRPGSTRKGWDLPSERYSDHGVPEHEGEAGVGLPARRKWVGCAKPAHRVLAVVARPRHLWDGWGRRTRPRRYRQHDR